MPDPARETVQIDDEIQKDGDAPRRTHLANERTFLAWWRSGLAAITVGFGIGKFGPIVGHTHETEWPYLLLGVGFVLLGGAFVLYGLARRRSIDTALQEGRRIPSDDPWFTGFTVATTLLSVGLLVLLVLGS